MNSPFVDDSQAVAPARSPRGPAFARALVDAVASRVQRHRIFIKFLAVGAVGYVVYLALIFFVYDLALFPFLPDKDTSVDLLLFTHDDALLLITSLIATQLSIVAVFIGHNLWTFADRQKTEKSLAIRFLQFEGRALVSTLGILTVAVNVLPLAVGIHPSLALLAGMAIAFAWNWILDSRFIWAPRSDARQAR